MTRGRPDTAEQVMGSSRLASVASSPMRRVRLDDPRVSWVAFACISAAGLAFVMWKGRGNGFFYDEWSWIQGRRSGLHAILSSYNQHLVIVPVAVYQFLLRTAGLGHYWIYRLLAVAGHLACAAAVFAFARRRIGVAALLPAAVVVFLGSGWEYILEGVNFGFTTSLALGITALLALDRDDRRGDLIACGLLVLALLFSEFVLLFAFGIAVELAWRDHGLRRAWVWGVQLALYALWWLAYHQATTSTRDLSAVPKFIVNMASSAAGGLFGLNLVDGRPVLILVAALIVFRVVRYRVLTPRLIALVVILGCFWVLVAVARAQLGQPWASRYVYTGVILITLILAESFRGTRLGPATLALAAPLTILAVLGNVRALNGGENYLHTGSRTVSAELGALQLAAATAPWNLTLDPRYGPQIVAGPYFAAVRAIGSSDAESPAQVLQAPEPVRSAADGVLLRAGELKTTPVAGPAAPGLADRAPVVERVLAGYSRSRASCVEFHPQGTGAALDLLLPTAGLELKTLAGPEPQIRARRFAAGFEQNPLPVLQAARTMTVQPAPDRSTLRWHVRVSSIVLMRVCALR